jgi:hypothetical protein
VDWSRLRLELKRDFGSRFFVPTDDNVVDDRQWGRGANQLAGPLALVPADGPTILNLFGNHLSLLLDGVVDPVIVGVQRKGMALLFELLQANPKLRTYPWTSNTRKHVLVTGKDVIVIDDCIRTGEGTCDVPKDLLHAEHARSVTYAALVGTDDGCTQIGLCGAVVRPMLPVPMAGFEEVEQTVLIPALESLRCGILANQVGCWVAFEESGDQAELRVRNALIGLLDTEGVSTVAEVLPTSDRIPTFHGNVELSDSLAERLVEHALRRDPGFRRLEETKLRFFLRGHLPLRVYAVAIVHFRSTSPEGVRKQAERQTCEWLLQELTGALTITAARSGARVRASRPKRPDEVTEAEFAEWV